MVNFFYEKIVGANNGLNLVDRTIKLGGALTSTNTNIIGNTDGGQDLFIGDTGNYALNKRLRYFEVFTRGDIVLQSYAGASTTNFSSVYLDGTQAIFGIKNTTNSQYGGVRIFPASGVGINTRYNLDRFAFLRNDNLSTNRIYQFPDASGTFLLDTTFSPALDGTYARLDATNQPFTGDLSIYKANSRHNFLLKDNLNATIFGIINSYAGVNNWGVWAYDASATFDLGTPNSGETYGERFIINDVSASRKGIDLIVTDFFISRNDNRFANFRHTTLTGLTQILGTAQNLLTVSNGLKFGNNTDIASVAGFGSIKAVSDIYYGTVLNTTTPTWEKFAFVGMDKNITTVATGTYAILSTDNILDITVTCSATLPTITADLVGKEIQIYGENIPVTVNRGGADLIDGAVAINMVGYSVRTLKAMKLGVWRAK